MHRIHPQRRLVLLSLGLWLGLWIAAGQWAIDNPAGNSVQAAEELPMSVEAKQAVDRAIAFLKANTQFPNGFPGQGGVAALAMLKAGVPAHDPLIAKVITWIRAQVEGTIWKSAGDSHHIYEAGVFMMVLGTADPVAYRPEMQAITNYIISQQGTGGDWDYPSRQNGDTSITQYAVLGLWEATRAGIDVPLAVWDKMVVWHLRHQAKNGGFVYHPIAGAQPPDGATLHTMTTAAVGSLLIARRHLFPNANELIVEEQEEAPVVKKRRIGKRFGVLELAEEDAEGKSVSRPVAYARQVTLQRLNEAVQRGLEWLRARFTVAPQTEWRMYYLYGFERLSALTGEAVFAGHNWYVEGSEFLCLAQKANGSWEDSTQPVPATSLSVLFLIRATAKIVKPIIKRASYGEGLMVGGRGLPGDLSALKVNQGEVQVRKNKGPVDELLAKLEASDVTGVEETQTQLVEKISLEEVQGLVGQKDRLIKLVRDPRAEVRRTAYWALGRTNDLTAAPVLIEGLNDIDGACVIEARNALQFLSRKPLFLPETDEPTPQQRREAIVAWKKWYMSARPYQERDDLTEGKSLKP